MNFDTVANSFKKILETAGSFYSTGVLFPKAKIEVTRTLLSSRHQIGLNKVINVAIQDAADVSHFQIGPMILNHLVGMENIGADLASPSDVFF